MKRGACLVFASFLLAGCVAPKPAPQQSSSMPTPVVETIQQEAENTKSFTVIGDDFSFDVKEIKVKKGDTVKITFKNSHGFHDWRLDEFSAATKVLKAGQEETVTFVADKVGTFEYYCSVNTHRKMGMKGNLIVE